MTTYTTTGSNILADDFNTTSNLRLGLWCVATLPVLGSIISKIGFWCSRSNTSTSTGDLRCARYLSDNTLVETSATTISKSSLGTTASFCEFTFTGPTVISINDIFAVYETTHESANKILLDYYHTVTYGPGSDGAQFNNTSGLWIQHTAPAPAMTITYGDTAASTTTMPPPPAWVRF